MQLPFKDKLARLAEVREPAQYHPEGNTLNHIMLVTIRAFYWTKADKDLIAAALLHDICKGDSGFVKNGHWSNPDHPKQAFEYIYNNDDVRYFIKAIGGRIPIVADICRAHMACKDHIPNAYKSIPKIDTFVKLDDMIGKHKIEPLTTNIDLPNYKTFNNFAQLEFVGQSFADVRQNQNNCTVVVNRNPFYFPIKDLFDYVISKI